jgi:hypothetical protein
VVSQFGFPHRDPEAFGEEFRHGFRSLSQNSTLFAKRTVKMRIEAAFLGDFRISTGFLWDFYGNFRGYFREIYRGSLESCGFSVRYNRMFPACGGSLMGGARGSDLLGDQSTPNDLGVVSH